MEFDWKTWFLGVWEDNRRLTDHISLALADADAIDKVIVEGMRPFREMVLEIIGMERWNVRGLAHELWDYETPPESLRTAPVSELMDYGRQVREETRRLWVDIPAEAFTRMRPAPASFIPPGRAVDWLTYALENEIHHRGQGYVYLRLLGQTPPPFYVR
ncbi:hypothetical protein JZ785_14185 [Alicyclobacillus curvatus]|jgi:uncharacterized damage-inducible protein DinB|nr:hypothetical protein JZ785_14185 [Alicyclobacillus curvatus]